MFLIINTANNKSPEVILAQDSIDFNVKEIEGEQKQAENLLLLIKASLDNQQKELSDLRGVAVITGPGRLPTGRQGFTALRIGVVTANVLAYALGIPVAGLNLNEFKNNQELVAQAINKLEEARPGGVIMPEYGREPNIS